MPDTTDRSLWRRGVATLRRFIVAHPVPFATSVAGSSVFALTAVLGTVVLGRVTDRVVIPAFEGDVASTTIWAGAIAIVVVAFIRSAGVITRRYFAGMTAAANMATLRHQIADRYLDVPLSFHRERTTGTLLAHADNDVMVAAEVINPLPFSTGLVLLIVFSLISLFAIDPLLTLVGLVLFPAMFVLNRFYTRRVELPAQTVQERVGDVSAITHESFEGAMVVKTLGRQDAEVERLAGAADQLRVARVRVGALRALFEPTLDALPNLAIIVLLAVGGWRVSTGAVSPGDLVQAMALFTLLAFPDARRRLLARGDAAFGRRARPHRRCARRHRPNPCRHIRRRCRVDRSTSKPMGSSTDTSTACRCCRAATFDIASGEVVALVGPTGCGKTTLCELLAGLDRPDRGVVRVGGIDLTEVTRRRSAQQCRPRVPGVVPVHRHDREQHHDRNGGERNARCAGRPASRKWRGSSIRLPAAYETVDRRAGSDGVGRPAAAHRARTRADAPAAVHAARRRDVGRRRDRRGADPARAARRARHDDADRRPPGLDDRAGRPRVVHAGRPHRRDRARTPSSSRPTATTRPWCAPTSKRLRDGTHRRRRARRHRPRRRARRDRRRGAGPGPR